MAEAAQRRLPSSTASRPRCPDALGECGPAARPASPLSAARRPGSSCTPWGGCTGEQRAGGGSGSRRSQAGMSRSRGSMLSHCEARPRKTTCRFPSPPEPRSPPAPARPGPATAHLRLAERCAQPGRQQQEVPGGSARQSTPPVESRGGGGVAGWGESMPLPPHSTLSRRARVRGGCGSGGGRGPDRKAERSRRQWRSPAESHPARPADTRALPVKMRGGRGTSPRLHCVCPPGGALLRVLFSRQHRLGSACLRLPSLKRPSSCWLRSDLCPTNSSHSGVIPAGSVESRCTLATVHHLLGGGGGNLDTSPREWDTGSEHALVCVITAIIINNKHMHQ